MHSSTSNSNRFIARSLVITLVLIVAYLGLLETPLFRFGGGIGNSDWQNCIIRAERYLYDLTSPDILIMGTSRAARIRTAYLGPRVYNFAYPCLSGETAIHLIRDKKIKPRLLLIELNELLVSEDHTIIEDIYRFAGLKRHLKILRQEYKPVLVLKKLAQEMSGQSFHEWYLPQVVDHKTGMAAGLPDEVRLKALKEAEIGTDGSLFEDPKLSSAPDFASQLNSYVFGDNRTEDNPAVLASFIKNRMAAARPKVYREFIDELIGQGTDVAFFWMPQPKPVDSHYFYQGVRALKDQLFPDVPFFYDPTTPYRFSDILHVSDSSAMVFTRFLNQELEKLPSRKTAQKSKAKAPL